MKRQFFFGFCACPSPSLNESRLLMDPSNATSFVETMSCTAAIFSSRRLRITKNPDNGFNHTQIQVAPDVIVMTACMDALAAGGKWSEAITILDEMRSKGITPNERTYKVCAAVLAVVVVVVVAVTSFAWVSVYQLTHKRLLKYMRYTAVCIHPPTPKALTCTRYHLVHFFRLYAQKLCLYYPSSFVEKVTRSSTVCIKAAARALSVRAVCDNSAPPFDSVVSSTNTRCLFFVWRASRHYPYRL